MISTANLAPNRSNDTCLFADFVTRISRVVESPRADFPAVRTAKKFPIHGQRIHDDAGNSGDQCEEPGHQFEYQRSAGQAAMNGVQNDERTSRGGREDLAPVFDVHADTSAGHEEHECQP